MDWKYLFTSREGRISRKPFWLGSLLLFVVSFIGVFVLLPFIGLASLVLYIPIWIAGLMLMLKRAHDRDRPEWYVYGYVILSFVLGIGTFLILDPTDQEPPLSSNGILSIINVIMGIWGLILLVDLGFLRGTRGSNRYGSDPLSA